MPRLLWKGISPPKMQFTCWLAWRSRLKTFVFLQSVGVLDPNGSSLCCFCHSCAENVSHVFLHCQFAWSIWSEVVKWWSLVWVVPENITQLLDWWSGFKFKKMLKGMWNALPSVVMWYVWKARNEIKFAGSDVNWCGVCESIELHIAFLVKYHTKGLVFLVNDLLYNLKSIMGL